MVAAVSPVEISYDLSKYAQLDSEWKAQPGLYLDKYFTTHFYASTAAPKRKHGEIEANQTAEPHGSAAAAAAAATDGSAAAKEWQYVLMSPNKLCVTGISKHHPLLLRQPSSSSSSSLSEQGPDTTATAAVTRVVYADAVRNSVIKGKGKKQSLRVMPETKICTVHTRGGSEYVVRAAVRGVLVEWNARLEDAPHLVLSHPELAFVAIVKPATDDDAKILSECVDCVL
ncbi:hypothetical protein H4217_006192 [Coemansia sp. RSA 1939]|nr:hypothetical protein H4217_006192 [Coemansia sp. RSA 1939]KAJ2605530.1 hypothetical protein EV177_006135 [Coemansia sp. RSA 1804]